MKSIIFTPIRCRFRSCCRCRFRRCFARSLIFNLGRSIIIINIDPSIDPICIADLFKAHVPLTNA